MTFNRVARLDKEARKVFAVRLVRDIVRNRMAGQCSGVERCLYASLIESKVVLDGSKVKLRDPESILRELKISWMFVESQQQAFYKFGMLHDIVMSTCACCGITGHERHGGLWFIWPLGGNDENAIVVSGSVRTAKEMIQRQEDAVVTLVDPELNLHELKAALALMTECEKVHLEYSNLETSSGKHGHLVQMCPSEPDEKCKEIHHVWVKGSAENTWYPVYTTSKEEFVTQMRENIAKERSLEQHLSVMLSTCEGMSDRALIDERARWLLQEVTAESLMIAAESTLTETAFHRLEGYVSDSGSFVVRGWCDDKLLELTAFVADHTQAFLNVEVQEEEQLDFLESIQVYERVYVDILTSGTRVMTIQDERDPCLFENAEWGQASDWREAWNRIWNQREFQVYFAERTSVV